jgi:hypothetical protein
MSAHYTRNKQLKRQIHVSLFPYELIFRFSTRRKTFRDRYEPMGMNPLLIEARRWCQAAYLGHVSR